MIWTAKLTFQIKWKACKVCSLVTNASFCACKERNAEKEQKKRRWNLSIIGRCLGIGHYDHRTEGGIQVWSLVITMTSRHVTSYFGRYCIHSLR